MKKIIHKAETRGRADHGWLKSSHTFSFANYRNEERVHFGALRVLNDDIVTGGNGFGMHPHDNMEIITIPLEGTLEHKDSMGNAGLIQKDEIQVMSAGTGVFHSEKNASKDEEVKLLQIWVFPNKRQVTPRYDQIKLNPTDRINKLQQILSPSAEDEGVWIHQEAWFHMGKFEKGFETTYTLKNKQNGVYAFIVSGAVTINNEKLSSRDGLGVWEVTELEIVANSDSELLLMEIPMNID